MRRKPYKSTPFLPEAVSVFLKKRAFECAGLSLMLLAIFLCLSFLSYHPNDPSFNTVGGNTLRVENWLGVGGAYASDFFLQGFGYAALLFLPVILYWGLRVLNHDFILFPKTRVILFSLSLCILTLGFSIISSQSTFWDTVSSGGAIGNFLYVFLQKHLFFSYIESIKTFLPFIFFAIGFPLYFFSLGLPWQSWIKFIKFIGRSLGILLKALYALLIYIGKSFYRIFSVNIQKESHVQKSSSRSSIHEKKLKRVVAKQTPELMKSLFKLPPIKLLKAGGTTNAYILTPEEQNERAALLTNVLKDFGVKGHVRDVSTGPVVTLYEFQPSAGTKSSRVTSLAGDVARTMSAISARIAVIPGCNALGVELPNPKRQTVYLREILEHPSYIQTQDTLPLILGKNISGGAVIADLAKMPHLLVAGTTGSGKSVAINTMILSILYALPPEKVRFIMIDPKMLELSIYDGIPHLLTPVVTDPHKAITALKWVVHEMEKRYQAMSSFNVRNIEGYNRLLLEAAARNETLKRRVQIGFDAETGQPTYEEQEVDLTPLPYIIVVVDEMADLMLVAGKDIEAAVQRLAQMARASGIHLIMATQRPSVDVITGTIKANFPTRISFHVTSKIDSRTILGEQGAEQLLGQGDMLYMSPGGRIIRVHGPFVSDDEVRKIVEFLKSQKDPEYISSVTEDLEPNLTTEENKLEQDPVYLKALELIQRERKASTSFLQRHLQIGYNRAARIIDQMEENGVISAANRVGKRDVLVP